MQVLIVGAGEVGSQTAARLTQEGHSVSVIDQDITTLTLLQERADIQVVQGSGTSPRILKKAGLESADMVISVTDTDEVNMIASLIAGTMKHNPILIARIKNTEYEYNSTVLGKDSLALDLVLNPDRESVNLILKLVDRPHASYLADFFSGELNCLSFLATKSLIDRFKSSFEQGFAKAGWVPILIDRRGVWTEMAESPQVFEGDRVYCMVHTDKIRKLYQDLFDEYKPSEKIMVLGGNDLGFQLVKRLERENYDCKLIEPDRSRCFELAQRLQKTVVLHGQGSDESLLIEENIGNHDVFIAADEDEEVNILSCLLAKRLGTPRVIALSNKISYLPLLSRLGVDVSISPRLIAVKKITQFIRSEQISQVEIIGDGRYEMVEIEVFESDEMSGRPFEALKLPPHAYPIAMKHLGEVLLDFKDKVLNPKDRVIFLVPNSGVNSLLKSIKTGNP
jgi:trk system potassium uptake protein